MENKKFADFSKEELINKARFILRGSRDLDSNQLEALFTALEGKDQFAYATEILLVKMNMDENAGKQTTLQEYQKLARFIYKDHGLPSSFKFDKALHELSNNENLKTTENCETLGLVGAIYKRKWIFDNQFRNLILSRYYYQRGYELWKANKDEVNVPQNDNGFCAINFAFVNELMSVVKLKEHGSETGVSDSIIAGLNDARTTRELLISHFENIGSNGTVKWVLPILIEAYFGTNNYTLAKNKIDEYLQKDNSMLWEKRTLIKQLLAINDLKKSQLEFNKKNPLSEKETIHFKNLPYQIVNGIDSNETEALIKLLVGQDEPDEDISTGKLGLALSGGGFRAAFFEIGVLAALAEYDVLKKIEVISCVSGGSILGAYYYIMLKEMLESNNDNEIKQEMYITLVEKIEEQFFSAVRQNLRMRIFCNPFKNLKMITPQWLDFKWVSKEINSFAWLYPNKYSRTHRLGELYEKYLYAPLVTPAGKKKEPLYINGLYINPLPQIKDFNPSVHNWVRQNKVPQLILNSTSMNTGHNWQFTASWMGEPPGNIEPDIDAKQRLRRMYYREAPGSYKMFRLGYAVAASSCVPVMFEPLSMNSLYPGIKLQLIDGGVHDNQGIGALIEQECKNMIIADGSGQMPLNPESSKGILGNFYRADSILQERLRELQFLDVKSRNYTSLVKNLLIVHLKSDLHKPPYNWIFCEDPPRTVIDTNNAVANKDLTSYDILLKSQQLLSEIRTDLDAFSEVEASALMLSGYKQTQSNIKKTMLYNEASFKKGNWNFLAIDDFLTNKPEAEFIETHLKNSNKLAFKFLQVTTLKIVFFILIILLGMGVVYLFAKNYQAILRSGIPAKAILIFLGIFILGFINSWLKRIINYKSEIRQWIITAGLISGMAIVSNIYLGLINRFYLKAGRVKEIKRKYEKALKRQTKKTGD